MANDRNKRKIKIENYNTSNDSSKFSSSLYMKNVRFTVYSVFAVVIIMIASSYAIFSSVQKAENYNSLKVGTLEVNFTDKGEEMGNIINLNGVYPMSDSEGLQTSPYKFKITNTGTLNASYKIRIVEDADMIEQDGCRNNLLSNSNIKVSVNGSTPFILETKSTNRYEIESKVLNSGSSKTYSIRVWIDENSGNEVLGKHYHGKIVVESVNTTQKDSNSHIKAVYKYDENSSSNDFCLGGAESTCKEITKPNTYPVGTIVKYEVANGVEKYFNVLYDKGDKLIMQQRENTVYNTPWYSGSADNTKGPTTILPALETATNGWTNVNNQTYTAGVTEFGTGDFKTANTACTYTYGATVNASQCNGKTYPDFTKTNVKARMITAQEAGEMGCKIYKIDGSANMSCKKFMNNYIFESTSYGGTVEDDYHTADHNHGYWTASSILSYSSYTMTVNRVGRVGYNYTSDQGFGARAVIEINK